MARKKPSNRFLVRRTAANALAPINDYAHQKIAAIPFGEVVQCEIRFLRNPKFNRLYWGMISMVWENLDHLLFPQVENFHNSLKIMAGIREELVLPPGAEIVTMDGQVLRVGEEVRFYVPGSTAFHNMDDETFGRFFWFCADLIVKYWLPMAPTGLVAEVERLTGIRAPVRALTIAETRQALLDSPDGA